MKIGFLSLGCPKNLVDGEVMLGIARDAGHDVTSNAAEADVIVVNTCAFIDTAKQESIDAILEMAQHKKDSRCSRLVVTGCLAERYRDELRREIPEIDAVLGTGEVPRILDAIGSGMRDAGSGIRPESTAPIRFFRSSDFADAHERSPIPDPGSGMRDAGSGIRPESTASIRFFRSSDFADAHERSPNPDPGSGMRDAGSGIRPESTAAIRFFRSSDFANAHERSPIPDPGSRIPDPGSLLPAPGSRPPELPTYIYDADTPRLLTTPRHYAYVKIAEGCDYTCAFCIIPTLRGGYRSRTPDSIVREARSLAERGVRELLLISQDTTFYGIDRGERGALARLLRELNAIDGLEWIRLLYLYPTTITDDVLEAMADCEKVCRYIDLPLQHASANVLKRMRRPGNRKTYDTLLARIRNRVAGVTLRTTLIVGFPGESEADYGELEAFVSDTRFDHLGVFTYSHEEGTRAFGLPDDVPAAVKRRRRNRLMARQKSIVAAAQKARIGTEVDVIIDGPSSEHELVLQGRLEGQAPDIDPVVFLTECNPGDYAAGQLIRTRIVGARQYDLIARPIGELVNW